MFLKFQFNYFRLTNLNILAQLIGKLKKQKKLKFIINVDGE